MSKTIDEIWSDDLLDRRDDATFLTTFLVNKIVERQKLGLTRSFVLNIDSGWGEGKTFFLEKMAETLRIDGRLVALVNAWADDHAEDPLIAVMSEISSCIKAVKGISAATQNKLAGLGKISGRLVAAAAKGAIKQASNKYLGPEVGSLLGDGIGSLATEAGREAGKTLEHFYDEKGSELFKKFDEGKKSIKEFKNSLENVLSALPTRATLPLFVMIDELDRCRPTYAVSLLERTKHLFDVNDVVFIFATDTAKLKHSLSVPYGLQFDATRYLYRFFDQTYRFEKAPLLAFIEAKMKSIDVSKFAGLPGVPISEFTAKTFEDFGLAPRDIEQCIDIMSDCATSWSERTAIELVLLLPLVVAQQRRIPPRLETVRKDLEAVSNLTVTNWRLHPNILNRNNQIQQWPGWDIFNSFANEARKRFSQIFSEDYPSRPGVERYVRDLMTNEHSVRQSRERDVKEKRPLMHDYPLLVRKAGRFIHGIDSTPLNQSDPD